MRRRLALIAGALACFALAAALLLLAADVSRWRGALPADDVRYRRTPGRADLWTPEEAVPFGAARRVLGVEDDLAFRRALQAVRLGKIDEAFVSDPALALVRGEAQSRFQVIADGDDDPPRRSRALGLLGVLAFANSLGDSREQAVLLQEAIASFREAIAVDTENGEAKRNLELALQRGRGIQPAEASGGPNPSPGGQGSKGAGAGTPGSGY
jgi:hypothetical protein